mmetsp:Transcript_18695/g.24676  ORF Transcript_18695/g.24676 Transcript_18695/m.24676 type:complete len:231 (-) Transcript_18695:42-734(-)
MAKKRRANEFELDNENIITIFDWDDTLLPASWIEEQMQRIKRKEMVRISDTDKIKLQSLEEHAIQCIVKAKEKGIVAIITNSIEGWVQISAKKFFPRMVDHLKNVSILSARTLFMNVTNDPWILKKLAFSSYLLYIVQTQQKRITSLISIGDSQEERASLVHCSRFLPGVCIKSVKMYSTPQLGLLSKQLQNLACEFDTLYSATTHQDLAFDESTEKLVIYESNLINNTP